MNVIILAILVAGIMLLIHALLLRRGRDTTSDAPAREPQQRLGDAISPLSQQREAASQPEESVTASRTPPKDRSRCPACGALITANDERCPSCDIAFIADGSQKWTLGAVGPADGIFLPSREVKE